jgi:hypothetical protein
VLGFIECIICCPQEAENAENKARLRLYYGSIHCLQEVENAENKEMRVCGGCGTRYQYKSEKKNAF